MLRIGQVWGISGIFAANTLYLVGMLITLDFERTHSLRTIIKDEDWH